MDSAKKQNTLGILFVMSPLVLSFLFAMDIYIPDVPELTQVFHTSAATLQITLSIFMLTTGVGQLLIGPFSDQLGRFKIALASAIAFTIASVVCALSNDIEILIFGRLLQALGGCGMLVIAFSATRDLFEGDESAKIYSLLNCCMGISPLIAPIIGSYLNAYLGWRFSFWFLSLLGLIASLLIYFRFSETLPINKRVKVTRALFSRYRKILLHREFRAYAFCVLSAMSMFFVFFSFSPYIIIKVLKKPSQDFGFYFFTVGFTFFIGSYISAFTSKKIGIYKTVTLGALITLFAGLFMLLDFYQHGVTVFNFIAPCMILGIGGAFLLGAGAGGAMNPFPNFAGTAAALLGCVEFAGSALIGYFVLLWKGHSTIPIALTFIILSVASLLMCLKNKVTNRQG